MKNMIATVARSLNGSTQHHREKLVAEVIDAINESGTHRVVLVCPDDGNILADDGVCGFCGNAALNEPLSGDNPWSKFSREIYGRMLSALPNAEAET